MSLFGIQFTRNKKDENIQSIVPPTTESTVDVSSLDGFTNPIAHVLDTDAAGNIQSENELINKYRDTAMIPEVDFAVDEIASEAIIASEDSKSVEIDLDGVELSEAVKEAIKESYEEVYNLLSFNLKGSDIFRRWYVDGRINYAVLVDTDNLKEGIQEVRFIDPKKIKKVREIRKKSNDPNFINTLYNRDIKEYFMFNSAGIDNTLNGVDISKGIELAPDGVVYVSSGLLDYKTNIPLSYLHKALRPANNLRMLEDAVVIYRLTRAPERRIFYVDVGNLPKSRAEQYMKQIAAKHKSKIVYDVNTGEITNDRKHLAMTEDFWIPRRDGSRGTEIDTLAGGENLGQIEDVEYFKKKLYKSLNVPVSRMESEGEMFSKGTEITRDELRFARFISKLRTRFSLLFDELLERQLVLKGILSIEEWEDLRGNIRYVFQEDNYFAEALESEIMQNRIDALSRVDQYIGRFFSEEWVQKRILKMSDEEIEETMKQIKEEGSDKKLEMGEGVRENFDPDKELRESMNEFFGSLTDSE